MNQLTILGLGPGHVSYLTMEAYDVLKSSQKVWVRTERHPIIKPLQDQGVTFEFYDYLYEQSESFETVYHGIVENVLENLKLGDVIYAVPGNPFVAEHAVNEILTKWPKEHTRIIHGTSFLDAIITRLNIDPVHGLRVIDALRLDNASVANDDILVCIQCYNQVVASDLKIWLSRLYEDEHPIAVVRAVGIPDLEEIYPMELYELDRYSNFDHLTSVVVYQNIKTKRSSFDDLLRIMKTLRSPSGCPWDREQTHETLIPFVLEEAYEVVDAIRSSDSFEIEEELGDLLLQVVFHAQIGDENGDFTISDVLGSICSKMVKRHPHVFADTTVASSDDVLVNWEAIKKEENSHQTVTDVMKKLRPSLPALFRSAKIQQKAAKVGFDWPDALPVFDKLHEEIGELKEAIEKNEPNMIEDELGDLLFTVVNLARKLDVDGELALHGTAQKFIERFEVVEGEMVKNGLNMSNLTIEELENAWQRAKNENNFKNKRKNT